MPLIEQTETRVTGCCLRCDLCGANSDAVEPGVDAITDKNREEVLDKLAEKVGFISPVINESKRLICPECVSILKQAIS